MARSDNVRDTVCDHPRLTASRTGEDQQGTVDVAYGFALLRIKPFEEIHSN
jgi:hypothetical protein